MPELDHHPESESRYSCQVCEDSGVTKDEREYCSCRLGAARKNSDRFAEMLRGVPHTEAIWTATHATMKAERATAAAEKAVLNMQLNGYAKDSYAKDLRIAELERELAEVRKDAERYRHLRDAETLNQTIWDALDGVGSDEPEGYSRGFDMAVDAAIDAASVAQANKEQG